MSVLDSVEKKLSSVKPIVLAAIAAGLGLIVLALFITVIVLAVRPSVPLISFSHFTAECMTIFKNGDSTGLPHVQMTKDVVFSDHKWYVDSYYEGELISRLFSTKDDASTFTCERVGNHDNCYIVSSDDEYNFEIPRSAIKQKTAVDCSEFAKVTGRKFEECDVYTFSQGLWVKQVYVESDTDYPVMVQTTRTDTEATITETYYMSFDPKKPTDESGLSPFKGVKVYDFRDGKGDAGVGGSNVYTKASATESFVPFLSRMFSHKKVHSREFHDDRDPLHAFKELREMLHLPPRGLPSKYVSRSRSENARRSVRAIPSSFDAREYWSNCKSVINTITDQDICGSCWAMSASSVLADRFCIATNASTRLSPQYLVYCSPHNMGCSGAGSEIGIWEDIRDIGIPEESCVPFTAHNGPCPTRCEDGTKIDESNKVYPKGYTIPWGKTDAERVKAIQEEIMTNGPVEAFYWVFTDFSDFFESSTGVYHRSADAKYKGWGHAIRILGWGTENGQDYWLIANSYGTNHPGKGFFKMRRGNNECNLEEQIAAGTFS